MRQVPIPAPCIAALTVLSAPVDTRERTPASQIEQTPVLLPGNRQPRARSLRTLIQVPAGLPWAQEHRPERAVLAATDLEARPPDGTLVAAGSRAERQTCTRLRSCAVAYRIGDLAARRGCMAPLCRPFVAPPTAIDTTSERAYQRMSMHADNARNSVDSGGRAYASLGES